MSEGLYIFGLVGAVCGGVCGVVLVPGLKIARKKEKRITQHGRGSNDDNALFRVQ